MGDWPGDTQQSHPYFLSILEDKDHTLWMATYDQGVFQYKGDELRQFPITANNSLVNLFSVYSDRENTIWLGTQNDGVYKRVGKKFIKFEP